MIGEVKQKGNRFYEVWHRENWKEFFCFFVTSRFVRRAEIGESIPRFYLPVYRIENRGGWMVWIMPLAPFVMVGVAAWRGFKCFWLDLINVIETWE